MTVGNSSLGFHIIWHSVPVTQLVTTRIGRTIFRSHWNLKTPSRTSSLGGVLRPCPLLTLAESSSKSKSSKLLSRDPWSSFTSSYDTILSKIRDQTARRATPSVQSLPKWRSSSEEPNVSPLPIRAEWWRDRQSFPSLPRKGKTRWTLWMRFTQVTKQPSCSLLFKNIHLLPPCSRNRSYTSRPLCHGAPHLLLEKGREKKSRQWRRRADSDRRGWSRRGQRNQEEKNSTQVEAPPPPHLKHLRKWGRVVSAMRISLSYVFCSVEFRIVPYQRTKIVKPIPSNECYLILLYALSPSTTSRLVKKKIYILL